MVIIKSSPTIVRYGPCTGSGPVKKESNYRTTSRRIELYHVVEFTLKKNVVELSSNSIRANDWKGSINQRKKKTEFLQLILRASGIPILFRFQLNSTTCPLTHLKRTRLPLKETNLIANSIRIGPEKKRQFDQQAKLRSICTYG